MNPSKTAPQQDEPTSGANTQHASQWQNSWRGALLLVALAATVVISPMFFLGQASGHDIQFHLASWMDVARQWREGVFFPRWAEWANWGYGEPRFIFYPPASWMAGAALGSVLPWKLVPGTFIWLTLITAGMAMWKLAHEWMASPQAEVAALFFTINPYNLVTVYYRSDYAELLAIALLPLALMYTVRVVQEGSKHVPMLALAFAAIWLSNAPAAVIVTYSLPLILGIGCVLHRKLRPLLVGGAAMAAGLGLAAFYILPAAWERRWVQIGEVLSEDLSPSHNFLFTHSSDVAFQIFNWKVSYVAIGVAFFTIVAAAISARKRRRFPEMWWGCVALGTVSIFLMLPWSTPFWNHLPELQFVQFPWRWLATLNLAFAFLTAASMTNWKKHWAKWVFPIAVLAAIGIAATKMVQGAWWDSCDSDFIAGEISTAHGYEGTDEYQPLGDDRTDLVQTNPGEEPKRIAKVDPGSQAIIPAAGVRLHIERWTAEQKIFDAETHNQVELTLHILEYPAWTATADGKSAEIEAVPDTAQMLLTLPPGEHRVEIRFRRTWDRVAGDAITLISATGLFGFAVQRRRSHGSS